jgi:predicted nuclease with TOPRIM domain
VRERLQARLRELKQELETGQAQLQELEQRSARLRETLLRISGAVQVLEEELARDAPEGSAPVPLPTTTKEGRR